MLLHRVHILCILIFLSPDHQYSHLLNPFLLWIRIYLTELAVYETLILIHFSAYFYLEHFFLKAINNNAGLYNAFLHVRLNGLYKYI